MKVSGHIRIEETHDDIAINELRRFYDRINTIYDGIKLKILALIAGEVAIVPFIFTGFPILTSPEAKIFLGFGIGLLSVSFALLLWAISTADWQLPFGSDDSRNAKRYHRTPDALKAFIKKDYESSIDDCLKKIRSRAKAFNVSLWLLTAGLIILFVLKYT